MAALTEIRKEKTIKNYQEADMCDTGKNLSASQYDGIFFFDMLIFIILVALIVLGAVWIF